jgi:hypothetical protein
LDIFVFVFFSAKWPFRPLIFWVSLHFGLTSNGMHASQDGSSKRGYTQSSTHTHTLIYTHSLSLSLTYTHKLNLSRIFPFDDLCNSTQENKTRTPILSTLWQNYNHWLGLKQITLRNEYKLSMFLNKYCSIKRTLFWDRCVLCIF